MTNSTNKSAPFFFGAGFMLFLRKFSLRYQLNVSVITLLAMLVSSNEAFALSAPTSSNRKSSVIEIKSQVQPGKPRWITRIANPQSSKPFVLTRENERDRRVFIEDMRQAITSSHSSTVAMIDEIDWVARTAPNVSPVVARKIERGQLDWKHLVEVAKASVDDSTSLTAYFGIVKDLLSHIGDGHVYVRFATKVPYIGKHIPLSFYTSRNRVFVKDVFGYNDRGMLRKYGPASLRAIIRPHDEVTNINGKSAIHYLKDHARARFGVKFSAIDLAFTASRLLNISSWQNVELPMGPMQMHIQSSDSSPSQALRLHWTTGNPRYVDWAWNRDPVLALIPNLGKRLICAFENYSSAIQFEMKPNATIGYVKFGVFSKSSFTEVKRALTLFEKSSQLAIIDLRNNSGGLLNICYDILSLLISRPFKAHSRSEVLCKFRSKDLCQSIIYNARFLAELKDKVLSEKERQFYERSLPLANQDLFAHLVDYMRGEKFSKMRISNYQILPLPHHRFTKPLIVLINESSCSSAQFMAATLQDQGRALIFGVSTAAGSGGNHPCFNDGYPLRGPYAIASLNVPNCDSRRTFASIDETMQVVPDVECPLEFDPETGKSPSYDAKLKEVICDLLDDVSIAQIAEKFTLERGKAL